MSDLFRVGESATACQLYARILVREPRRLVTDKLRSYEAAHRTLMPSVVHETDHWAGPTARATNARVQIRGSGATILVCTRSHPESLPNRTPPAAVSQPLPLTVWFLPCLARGNMCLMSLKVSHKPSQPHSNDAKLTVPLGVLRRTVPRPQIHNHDRLFWIVASRIWEDWQQAPVIVKPATVIKWHRQDFKTYWRWKSRTSNLGRPS